MIFNASLVDLANPKRKSQNALKNEPIEKQFKV